MSGVCSLGGVWKSFWIFPTAGRPFDCTNSTLHIPFSEIVVSIVLIVLAPAILLHMPDFQHLKHFILLLVVSSHNIMVKKGASEPYKEPKLT